MNKCSNCGYEGNDQFCPYCGSQMQPKDAGVNSDAYSQNGYSAQQGYEAQNPYNGQTGTQPDVSVQPSNYGQAPNYVQPVNPGQNNSADSFMSGGFGSYQPNGMNIPPEYRPIGMWGYFGYTLLFSIPCLGVIMLCVFAFGGTVNLNLRNYARSYFCLLIIGAVLLFFFFTFGFGASMYALSRY